MRDDIIAPVSSPRILHQSNSNTVAFSATFITNFFLFLNTLLFLCHHKLHKITAGITFRNFFLFFSLALGHLQLNKTFSILYENTNGTLIKCRILFQSPPAKVQCSEMCCGVSFSLLQSTHPLAS